MKRPFSNLFSGLLVLSLGEIRRGDGRGKQGMERERGRSCVRWHEV